MLAHPQGQPENSYEIKEPAARRFPWLALILGVGLLAMFGVAAWQHSHIVNLQLELKQISKEVATLRDTASQSDAELLQTLHMLREELDTTKKSNEATAKAARDAVRRQTQILETRIAKRQEEQREQIAQQAAQLDEIRSSGEATRAKLTDVTTEVGAVRTDVSNTRSDLDKTVTDLRRTMGDMGVMSGLIATNSRELAALKELGQRDYYEFTLTKAQKRQRVGDILLQVKKTDIKRNKFTVEIVVEDKRVEKKDRTINEPVQFYVTSKARQPYELVVNEVKKDVIVGYLAMPKVKLTAQR